MEAENEKIITKGELGFVSSHCPGCKNKPSKLNQYARVERDGADEGCQGISAEARVISRNGIKSALQILLSYLKV